MRPILLPTDGNGQADFIGRDVDLRLFFDRSWSSVVAVNIIGLLGSGKTAFLHHVAEPGVLQQHLGDSAARFCFVFVDMHGLSSPQAFSHRLAEHIAAAAGIAAPPRRNDWYEQLRATLSLVAGRRVVVLLDRLDLLFSEQEAFKPEFFVALRSLIEDPKLACVATSHWTLDATWLRARGVSQGLHNSPLPSPLYNLFQPIRLGALEERDIEPMIRRTAERAALALRDDEVSWVRRTAGGLPYFVRRATMALVNAHLLDRSPAERIAEAGTRFQDEVQAYYHYIWKSLQREEQRVLQLLATGEPAQPPDLASNARVQPRLVNYGLLRHNSGGYAINGEAFAEWLCDGLPGGPVSHLTLHERLQQALSTGFSEEELLLLCADINADLERSGSKERVEFEDIGGEGKSARVDNLISYCERRRIVEFLARAVERARPNAAL